MATFAGISRHIADENAYFFFKQKTAYEISIPFVKTTDFVRHTRHYAVNQGKRFVLPERNEMNFIVNENALTLSVEEQRAVIWRESSRRNLVRWINRVLPFNRSGKKRMLELD